MCVYVRAHSLNCVCNVNAWEKKDQIVAFFRLTVCACKKSVFVPVRWIIISCCSVNMFWTEGGRGGEKKTILRKHCGPGHEEGKKSLVGCQSFGNGCGI